MLTAHASEVAMPTMVPRGGVVEADAPPQTHSRPEAVLCYCRQRAGPPCTSANVHKPDRRTASGASETSRELPVFRGRASDRDSTTVTCHLGNNLGPGRWQLQALVDDQVQGEALFTIKAECDPSVDPQDYERLARDDGIDDAPSDEARR